MNLKLHLHLILYCLTRNTVFVNLCKSTITNLLIFYSDLVTKVHEKGQIDAIYTDLRKAFDSVNHDLLISKLELLGVIFILC